MRSHLRDQRDVGDARAGQPTPVVDGEQEPAGQRRQPHVAAEPAIERRHDLVDRAQRRWMAPRHRRPEDVAHAVVGYRGDQVAEELRRSLAAAGRQAADLQARPRRQLDEAVTQRRDVGDRDEPGRRDPPARQPHARKPTIGRLVQSQHARAEIRPIENGSTA